jgi:putative two-component system hydrogenase maturation factor HypX/HoxX
MRILLLVHSFNSLSQRLYVELTRDGHELSLELDIHDRVTRQAVDLFRPEVILAPYLKRAIPPSIWQRHVCLILHPGPPGDRGPAALDWAILRGVAHWGVTVLQANAEFDAGPIWASASFPMRAVRKSSLYRNEVTEAAVSATRAALERIASGSGPLCGYRSGSQRGWQPALRQAQRAIDWNRDDTATVLRKIHSADGFPGVEDLLFDRCFRLFDAHLEPCLAGRPGMLIARRHDAICRATRDGAVWIGQLQPVEGAQAGFKRPAVLALGALAAALPRCDDQSIDASDAPDASEIRYEERGAVGYLHFEFYNGALSVSQCRRLRAAYAQACQRPTRVIVLLGGADFWCNGMHLHCIEADDSPADASWDNINHIDDLAHDILSTDTHMTIAALQGNAAAGGVFLAIAADRVLARTGVVLNPHYRNMGNLYGSEYWTYTLPRRVGAESAQTIMARRLPLGTAEACTLGLIDGHAGPDALAFRVFVDIQAAALAGSEKFAPALTEKAARRARDEGLRPLADYRAEELARMRMNFYGFDPSYHIARHRFVHRTPHAWTPLHLARHRRLEFADRAEPASV